MHAYLKAIHLHEKVRCGAYWLNRCVFGDSRHRPIHIIEQLTREFYNCQWKDQHTEHGTTHGKYDPNSTWLWLDTFDFVERVESTWLDTFNFVEPCFSNMADDEKAVVLACTSLVFCALSVHVNKTEKRWHAVWWKTIWKKERLLDATFLFWCLI